jgi:6-phospho-beta-glucosidase
MKIAIFGGSAQSTPALIEYLARQRLPSTHVVLVGRSARRLEAVRRACNLLAGAAGPQVSCVEIWEKGFLKAVAGADVVLIQVRVGGYAGRHFDETFPREFGCCGDEGLGPGGLAAAWRSWPLIQEILSVVQDSCPGALTIMMSSPVGILTRAAMQAVPKAGCLGICELPWTTVTAFCRRMHADVSSTSYDYFGINHIGWLYRVTSERRDLINEFAISVDADSFPAPDLVRHYGAFPTKYLQLHFDKEKLLLQQNAVCFTRAEELQRISDQAISMFETGSLAEVSSALELRHAPWYAEAVGPLIVGWARGDSETPLFLTVRNETFYERLEADDVVELAHRVAGKKIARVPRGCPVPEKVGRFVEPFVAYERAATSAIMKRDALQVEEALLLHPWVSGESSAMKMAQQIVSQDVQVEVTG